MKRQVDSMYCVSVINQNAESEADYVTFHSCWQEERRDPEYTWAVAGHCGLHQIRINHTSTNQ